MNDATALERFFQSYVVQAFRLAGEADLKVCITYNHNLK
jgi:hypothetical protein